MGEIRDDLYDYIPSSSLVPSAMLATHSCGPDLWRMRLGHPSTDRLSKLSPILRASFPRIVIVKFDNLQNKLLVLFN